MNKKQYTWGIGIEHEMHLFHIPKNINNKIADITVFDADSAVNRIFHNVKQRVKSLVIY